MANVFNNLFGGGKASTTAVPSAGDSDFADFADSAPDPAPEAFTASTATAAGAVPAATSGPYTKWYRLDERHTWRDFQSEGLILAFVAVIVLVHLLGARKNRSKARAWMRAHAAPLASEFALVGCSAGVPPTPPTSADGEADGLRAADEARGEGLLREKSLFEFATYATGRANVAFVDVKLSLLRRFNPVVVLVETLFGFFFESMAAPADALEAVLYPFDGQEAKTVPGLPGAAEVRARDSKSSFDGFVWALVHKEQMKKVRDERYDLSITFTKDNSRLPVWLTVMSESAEITDALLTPELAQAAEQAGDLLEYLIITDQPIEKPTSMDETAPRKRIFLKYRLPSDNNYEPLLPLFTCFIRLADALVSKAHFRPEVLRKLRVPRDEIIKQIQKMSEEEKADERAAERERLRKAKRDQELSGLDAKAQKKYLEKEREKGMRKSQKKQTMRG